MKRIVITVILLGALYVLFTMNHKEIVRFIQHASLIQSGGNEDAIKATIVSHYNENVLIEQIADTSSVTYTFANIDTDSRKDIIAHIDTPTACGTGGCITTLFIQNDDRGFTPINFEFALKDIEVLSGVTYGMHDLKINDTTVMKWDGEKYQLDSF